MSNGPGLTSRHLGMEVLIQIKNNYFHFRVHVLINEVFKTVSDLSCSHGLASNG